MVQTEQAIRPLIVAEALAEGDAKETLTRVIDALRGAYGRLNAEEARAAALQTLEGQRDQIDLLQKQIDLVGEDDATPRSSSRSSRPSSSFASVASPSPGAEGQAILANAAAIEHLNQSLAQGQAAAQELPASPTASLGIFRS